jgi:pimeloyl-ACP methyl ester carboxylesterase
VRRPFAPWFLCSAALLAAPARAVVNPAQIEALFRPFLAEQVTLAPDGRHVAYTDHSQQELAIIIMALDEPYARVRIQVADDRGLAFSKDKERPTLRFLRWATANRLVFAPSVRSFPPPPPPASGGGSIIEASIMAVDADGQNPRRLIDAKDLSIVMDAGSMPAPGQDPPPVLIRYRTPEIMGFAVGDREHLLVQAQGFRTGQVITPTELDRVNVHTGKATVIDTDNPYGTYVYDWQARRRLTYVPSANKVERAFQYQSATGIGRWKPLEEALTGWDAKKLRITVENYFGEHVYPLGFDPNPDILYVASNVGRDTFGVYAFNLKTNQQTDLALEDPHVDLAPLEPSFPSAQLVFDEVRGQFAGVRSPGPQPVTVWHDPEIAAAQRNLEKKFPQRTVEILEWSAARTAFLIRVTGGTEPGRYFVFQQPENLALEILRRAPWLDAAGLHASEAFAFNTASGVHLTGYVTLPRQSRLNPPPAVVCFADGFPSAPHAEFSREAQVLAAMGFVVIRLNHRGVGGFGIKHRDAVLAGIDRVPVEDALATVDWIARRHPLDRKRIATLGNGFGGYLAVRALQLHPGAFRCAVAFNAPLDLSFWLRRPVTASLGFSFNFNQEVTRTFLERGPADLGALSVTSQPATLTNPVCLVLDPVRDSAITAANQRLRNQVRRQGGVADYLEVNADYAAELPQARARVYDHLEEFFNLNLYDYNVKIGPTKEIK